MGWLPFSSAGSDAKAQPQSQAQEPAQPATTPLALSTPPPPTLGPSNPPQPSPSTNDDDAAFYAAHPHLAPSSPSTTPSSKPALPPISSHLPRTMSCRAAFDSAFYCSSLGGHFNDIYRYGQLRACTEHWNDFWFCMRVNNSYNSRDTKERMVQERYREKEERVKAGPSSEDVWRVRGEGEGIEGAFGAGRGEDAK